MYTYLLGINSKILSSILSTLHGRNSTRERLFKGKTHLNELGTDVSFDIKVPPTVNLVPPTQMQWNNSINAAGEKQAAISGCFTINISNCTITIAGIEAKLTPIDIICKAQGTNGKLKLESHAAVVDMAALSDSDRIIYRAFLIPNILKSINTAIGSQNIPKISFVGMSFDTSVMVRDNILAVYSGQPDTFTLPEEEFFILLSKDTIKNIANNCMLDLRGKKNGGKDSYNYGLGKAYYEYSITLNDARVTQTDSPSSIKGSVSLTPYANAKTDVLFFVPISVGYKGHLNPNSVPIDLGLNFSGSTLRAEIKGIGGFSVVLEPSNPGAAIAWPVAQLVVTALTPMVKSLVVGNRFDLTTIETQQIDILNERINIRPGSLSMSTYNNMFKINGRITIN